MKLAGIDHITINCSDINGSFRFYEEVLNLKRLGDVDMGDHILHYYQLSDIKLELIEYKEAQKIYKTGNTDTGLYRHFAVYTDDIEEIRSRCKEKGYAINLNPTYLPQIDKTVMLIVDPNGVEIEIIQL
ncbi:metallothiol transferase FosB [Ruminiclostridium hungatei]|uniref:Metallothiol transferase FosB n=1 Tax=Ruminiclostridium hungatei TaxID=48256 RepID=A0A1V4SH47_RUMHU|nr:VOC family protein [Ruminiclostridium hungatei]OPX42785.1 metallothiol transferase FosB [Ruminiclostridium hungatei]